MCKLDIFADEIEARQTVTARYAGAQASRVLTPTVPDHAVSVWAQYTVRIPDGRRDEFRGEAQGGRRADGDQLPQAAAPTDRLSPFPRLARWLYRSAPRKKF